MIRNLSRYQFALHAVVVFCIAFLAAASLGGCIHAPMDIRPPVARVR